ncbi:MAG: hypothetical protein KDH20_20055 [Rhodocyclaceae bacterium]|nr:hypothetical protein [Rhodocyclaceae bacterium]
MITRNLLTLALVAGLASQAHAFSSEYALDQALAGFGPVASGSVSPEPAGPFRGESDINRDLAGFAGVVASDAVSDVRHAFRNEYDLNHGGPTDTAPEAMAAEGGRGEAVERVAFRGEYQLNRDLSGFARLGSQYTGAGDTRYAFLGEYDLTHGAAAAPVVSRTGTTERPAEMAIGYRSEFELSQGLAGFPA